MPMSPIVLVTQMSSNRLYRRSRAGAVAPRYHEAEAFASGVAASGEVLLNNNN